MEGEIMEQAKAPELRFRQEDGTDFPAWKQNKISDIADIIGGGTPKSDISKYWDGEIEWFTPTEITKKYVEKSARTISQNGLENSSAKLLPRGTILLTTRASIGLCAINNTDKKISTNQGFQSLVAKSSIDNEFLYYILNTEIVQKEMIKRASGSTFLELSPSNLRNIIISIPSISEQQKIASFFTALDHRIALADKKLVILQTIKKGMLQKIFSQELRFKDDDGNEFPAWKVKKLGDICQVNPKSPRLDDKFYYIDLDSVTNGQLSLKAPIQKDNAPSRAQRVVQLGDVLFQMVRPYQLNHYLVNKKFDLQTVASTGFAQLRCKENDSKFVYQILFTENFNHKVLVRCIGTGYPAINANDLSEIQTAIPSLPEQRKISDYFTALDDAIAAAQKKASALRAIKKGLLQKMFV